MGYLPKILFNKRSVLLSCLFGIMAAGFLQQPSQAQTVVEVEKKVVSDSKINLTSETSNQEDNDQNTAGKKQPSLVQSEETEEPLDFTSLGRSGQQTAGESRGSCPYVRTPLTAIAPKSNLSLTTKSHPRFWFYIPYSQSKISKLEFSIVDQSGEDITRYNLSVPQGNSYVSAVLPKTKPDLAINSPYKWHLKVYCDNGKKIASPTFVSGVLVRVKENSNDSKSLKFSTYNVQKLIDHDLWIDAVNVVLEKDFREDNDNKQMVWQDLLGSSTINLKLPEPQGIGL